MEIEDDNYQKIKTVKERILTEDDNFQNLNILEGGTE